MSTSIADCLHPHFLHIILCHGLMRVAELVHETADDLLVLLALGLGYFDDQLPSTARAILELDLPLNV